MRHSLFLLVLMPLFLSSCSSDDEVAFADTEIVLIPQATRIRKFGRYQIHKAALKTTETGVTCQWMYSSANDNGFTSDEDTLDWWPISSGYYTITAILNKGGSTKTITAHCNVEECSSGGFGFAFQSEAEIMANETMYAAHYYQTVPDVSVQRGYLGSDAYDVWKFKDIGKHVYRNYYFNNDGLYLVTCFSY